MIIVNLTGGLGNQLNHYSVGNHISDKYGTKVLYNIEPIKKDWQTVLYLDKLVQGLEYIDTSKNIAQHEKIINFDLKKKFNFDTTKNYKITNIISHPYEFIKLCPDINKSLAEINFTKKNDIAVEKKINLTNSVAVHIRRGDYVNITETRKKFGILTKKYYYDAINYTLRDLTSPFFFIFSDDIDWVEENFGDLKNKMLVSHNKSRFNSIYDTYKTFRHLKFRFKFLFQNRLQNAINDFNLMRCCKHFIIANSTFSWWAGFLGSYDKKIVICPYQWTNQRTSEETVPNEWIKII